MTWASVWINFLFGLLLLKKGVLPCFFHKHDVKITGGISTTGDQFPFAIRIIFKARTHCMGGLLTKEWVLTSAFCMNDIKLPSDLLVEIKRQNLEEPGGELIEGSLIKRHPNYTSQFSMYDVALIQLKSQATSSDFMKLEDVAWPSTDRYKRKCMVAGFGSKAIYETTSSYLKIVELTARHGPYGCRCHTTDENQRVICSNEKATGTCSEDEGAPLLCNNKVVGIAHQMYEVESCNPLRKENLQNTCNVSVSSFIYICPLLNWIKDIVQDASIPTKPDTCKGNRNIFLSIFLWGVILIRFSL
ncbi:trypsin 5G1-like [Cimex lectularius]|uniref:Peptidase S1 domain-containing protein n=1 Tax=Cimex lectularius TaxID=79782 RepID=A0A8I6TE28_CIMLE|nr:trypsin 5G1-like [Cimex lectularius]